MNDEQQIIADTASRRNLPEQLSAFRRVSPSNKYVFLVGGVLVSMALVGIYAFSRPHLVERKRSNAQSQLISKLMPRDEVTPDYIDSIGQEGSRRFAKSKEKPTTEEHKEVVTNPVPTTKPVSSMMLFTAGALSSQLGSLGVPMGTELSAVLENTVITADRVVPVIARITREYSKDGETLIPRNAKLFGSTQGMVEDRVSVRFTKVVFPDGKERAFSGIALDDDGVGGIAGDLKKKRGKRGRNVISSALIGASSVFAPTGAGFAETAIRGAHRGASGELSRDSQYYRRTEATPIVTIRAKTPFTILVDRAV
jgi:type IV secretory pathway VirB10-like protein